MTLNFIFSNLSFFISVPLTPECRFCVSGISSTCGTWVEKACGRTGPRTSTTLSWCSSWLPLPLTSVITFTCWWVVLLAFIMCIVLYVLVCDIVVWLPLTSVITFTCWCVVLLLAFIMCIVIYVLVWDVMVWSVHLAVQYPHIQYSVFLLVSPHL